MNATDLKRILISFADKDSDIIIDRGKLYAIIRGDVIEAKLDQDGDGILYIIEGDIREKAIQWIAKRIANLHQLADRILDYVHLEQNFIDPKGLLLDDIDNDPLEKEQEIESVTDTLCSSLNNKMFGTSKIVYITSDAGEGKTTLINKLAAKQAKDYKSKKVTSLIVPIPLGGRPFLRFDDIVVASLVNHLRFRLFYYDSFLELVKLGLIVPAFDGFEEMFMESSSGEALSATGNLINKLNSSGIIFIAARKAYFDYKSLSSQAKLFDTIGGNSVSFSRLAIKRWDKDQFLLYAAGRGIDNPEYTYNFIVQNIGSDNHPLLTRPVLINQLLDVVKSKEGEELIAKSLKGSNNYFPKFVETIVSREANSKWIDTSGEPFKPLLTVEQHHELLSLLAEEMWINNTVTIQESVLDLIAEIYCDGKNLSVVLSRQVKERLKQHALIVKSDLGQNSFTFDHDEFREFYLGYALFNHLIFKRSNEVKNLSRKGLLPLQSVDTVISMFEHSDTLNSSAVILLLKIQENEGPTSFIRENNGFFLIRLLNNQNGEQLTLENSIFPSNSLMNINLSNLSFKNCYFPASVVKNLSLNNVHFEKCTFEMLEFSQDLSKSTKITGSKITDSTINCIQDIRTENSYYDPYNINRSLEDIGFHVVSSDLKTTANEEEIIDTDEDMELVERALRRFLRSTYINDNIFKVRLGRQSDHFIRDLLPRLLENEIITEIDYQGAGNKRRFKLSIPFDKINTSLINSKGKLEEFMKLIKS